MRRNHKSAIGNKQRVFHSSKMGSNFLSPQTYLTHMFCTLCNRTMSPRHTTNDSTPVQRALQPAQAEACTTFSNGPLLCKNECLHSPRRKVWHTTEFQEVWMNYTLSVEHNRGVRQTRTVTAESFQLVTSTKTFCS